MSPTVHREAAYAFRFYSADQNEPPHIHVWSVRNRAKFWLKPVRIVHNRGFSQRELNAIEKLVIQHQDKLLEAWHDYFGN
ncbi:MAG: DUF4160 domain-containing protein [bacterium]